jgi:hypothetical protein
MTTTVSAPPATRPLTGYAAIAGGITSAVAGAVQAVRVDDGNPLIGLSEHVLLTLVAASLLLWMPAYLALGRPSGRLGTIGAWLAVAGTALLFIGMTSTNLHGQDYAWFGIVAVPANLFWLAGSVILAVTTWRSRTLPRALAVGVGLVWVTSIILSQMGGNLIAGAIFAAIGWLLVSRSRQG